MATTGFWPVKSRLKEAIDCAYNPDKTTERKYLDDDLVVALEYAENDRKTDQRMYVTGINCLTEKAYEQMSATKQRYGKLGGNVAYHGFQSFRTSEVTPEEAHQIGCETARAMWGCGSPVETFAKQKHRPSRQARPDYEIVVTTHLNTDNIHNHVVVNSVSFRTGWKFENHISDHYKLCEISDEICRELGKSVLEHSSFYGGEKGAYWVHKSGKQMHRDVLKADIEECLKYSRKYDDRIPRLRGLGYKVERTGDYYRHITVQAPSWKRPIRLDSLGYTPEALGSRFEVQQADFYFFKLQNEHRPYRPKQFPLESVINDLAFEVEHNYDTATVLVDTLFLIILTLVDLLNELSGAMLLSPDLRYEVKNFKTYTVDYQLLKSKNIRTIPQLENSISDTKAEIASLEADRQKVSNQIRRAKNPEDMKKLKTLRKEISSQITPLRKKLRQAEKTLEKSPCLYELLQTEHRLEKTAMNKLRERSYER